MKLKTNVGALALDNNNEGTWSINCPDNPDRKDGFKKTSSIRINFN